MPKKANPKNKAEVTIELAQEKYEASPLPTRSEYESLIDRLGIRHLLLGWWWDDEDKVYRRDETGEEMNEEEMIALRDQIADWQVDYFAKWPLEEEEKEEKKDDDSNILALLLLGIITLTVFEMRMRGAVQDAAVIQYTFGKGGFEQMSTADWAYLEGYLVGQYGFLSDFAEQIATGTLSEEWIAWETGLYFDSALSNFEQGRMKAQHNDLSLTRRPGDFTSQCRMKDRCFWSYTRTEDSIVCSWVRTVVESCPTCIAREDCPPVEFIVDTGEHINMICYEEADAS